MTEQKIIKKIAERVSDRTANDRQNQNQRRNQVVDMYGVEFTRQGDTTHPATFYISISPDLVYYERFEFKVIIQPFAIPVGNNGATGSTTVQVNNTSLSTNGSTITPNPHGHTTQPHNHSLAAGVSLFTSSVSNFEIWIEGINITPYLKAQWPEPDYSWINGEGVFPLNNKPEANNVMENYDILGIIGYMPEWQQGIMLSPGYKKVEFRATGAFNATMVNYLKYNHVNR